jgi:PAS domain S-box-containing protein
VHALLEAAVAETRKPAARVFAEPAPIHPEIQFDTASGEAMDPEVEGEYAAPDPVSCNSAMACAVETARGDDFLICVQRVRGHAPWNRFQRELFQEMCRHAASLLGQTRLLEEVRALKDRLTSLVDSMPSAIIEMDLLGAVTMWNTRAVELFGIPKQEALGRVCWKLIPEFAAVEDGIARELRMDPGATLDFDLITCKRRDGKTLFLRAALFTLFQSDTGELALRVDDVTATEELRRNLMVSQRRELQSALLGASAHELQNLLVAARGRVWLLDKGLPTTALASEIQALESYADKASETLGRLLAIAGDAPSGEEAFDLRDTVQESVDLCRRSLGASVSLLHRDETGPAPMWANRFHLEQAVLNLLLHAYPAIRKGGVLVVSLKTSEAPAGHAAGQGWVRLSAEAKGGSVVPGDSVPSHLGWTVALALTENLGGSGSEEKTGAGSSVFHLYFPLSAQAGKGETKEAVHPQQGQGRVMVVQADHRLRETLLKLLADMGHKAEGCADSGSVIRQLDSGAACDLAIVDWDMPVLNGRDTATVLRTLRPGLRLLFIGVPLNASRNGLPPDAVLLPRFHRPQEFAAAVQAALRGETVAAA